MTNTDRIDELRNAVGEIRTSLGILGTRADTVERRIESLDSEVLRERLVRAETKLEATEKRLDEVLARRWELWKLVAAAFLGGLVTLAASFLGSSLDRWISGESIQKTANES